MDVLGVIGVLLEVSRNVCVTNACTRTLTQDGKYKNTKKIEKENVKYKG